MSGDKNRVSVDSEFSFESRKMAGHKADKTAEQMVLAGLADHPIDIKAISLSDIQDLQFNRDVSDTLKLAFIKSLLIKVLTLSTDINANSASYKSLVSDLDHEINMKLNSMFVLPGNLPKSNSFQTLDPAVKSGSSSSLLRTTSKGNEKSDSVSKIEPQKTQEEKVLSNKPSQLYNLSNGSSDYAAEELKETKSTISSNYSTRNNSKTDLTQPQSRNSSIYSPKSPTHLVAESISSSKLSNSPSATYNYNRIQLPSPRNDQVAAPVTALENDKLSENDTPPPRARPAPQDVNKTLSPIINPFSGEPSSNAPSQSARIPSESVFDPRKNKSSGSLLLADNSSETDLEQEKERLRRNPNRYLAKGVSNEDLDKHKGSAKLAEARSSPVLGRNTPVVRGHPGVLTDPDRTPKMYGMGIMGLDSPVVVRRDASPSASPREHDKTPMYKKSNPNLANGHYPRDRYNQGKKQPQYPNYTTYANRTPTIGTGAASVSSASNMASGMLHPATPQSPGFPEVYSDSEEPDSSLFIQPKEFHTISLKIVTTLSIAHTSNYDPTIVFATVDKVSQKEIWRFKKTFSQLTHLDSALRQVFESFLLPPLPPKAMFLTNLPAKIDSRRHGLLDYFGTLFSHPKLPRRAVYIVCKFISTNTVNPLDDVEYNFSNEINEKEFKKQGYLVRRNKGLGSNWRVRYCKCEGPYLEVYDAIDGNVIDSIRLIGAQIGRQQSDPSADESSSNAKGYRHALLLKEMKKNSLGSNKHIFCAENDEERDSWIDVLIEYVQETEYEELDNISSSYATLLATPRHARTRSADLVVEARSSDLNSEAPSPSVSSPKHLDSEFDEPKKLRKRFFGGIRNKLGNTTLSASPVESEAPVEEFQMNPVTDLSGDISFSTPNTSVANGTTTSEYETAIIFGNTLDAALRLSASEYEGKKVPSIVFRCLDYLSQTGAGYQEGIFRLSGSSTMIKHLKEKFDQHYDVDLVNLEVRPEINSITGLLKLYLRELPENILTTEVNTRLHGILSDYNNNLTKASPQLNRIKVDDKNNSAYLTYIYQTRSLINQLPTVNHSVLYVLFKFLNREVLGRSDYNKMNLRNLVIVFSATLNIESKILAEFFINFSFLWENGGLVNEQDRPNIDVGSIPLM